MAWIGLGQALNLLMRATPFPVPVDVVILAAAVACMVLGIKRFIDALRSLPAGERRRETRQAWIGGVGAIVGIAALTGLIYVVAT